MQCQQYLRLLLENYNGMACSIKLATLETTLFSASQPIATPRDNDRPIFQTSAKKWRARAA